MESNQTQARQSICETIRTHIPVSITSFDHKKQTCTVKILCKLRQYGKILIPDNLVNVPLVVKGDDSFVITYPMRKFPIPAFLVVMDRSIDNWHESGALYDPKDKRTHNLSDCFVELGGRSEAMTVEDYNANNLEIRSLDGKTKIEISDNGTFNIKSPNDELFQILSDLLGHLIATKAVVSSGSSKGQWITNKSSDFAQIKSRIDSMKL